MSKKTMNEAYHIVIPARMASERLPGKPLAEIKGKPLLEYVYRRAMDASAALVVIATDDERIRSAGERFGAQVVMTSADHTSGSDRIAECAESLGWPGDTLIVNLQGDEPLMPAPCLDQVADLLAGEPDAEMASLYWPIESEQDVRDPNIVKVVTANDGTALSFSRSAIPYPRRWGSIDQALKAGFSWKRHIGLYAYRVSSLHEFSCAPQGTLEQAERLEQLRVLETGGRIVMAEAAQFIPSGVDTPEDLERVRSLVK